MLPGPREWALNHHIFRFEPPDAFWMKYRGPVLMEDAVRVVAIYEEMSEVRPFFFVAELKDLGRFDPEAGRYLSDNLHSEWVRSNIYIGARLVHRALAKGFALASLLMEHGDKYALEKIHHVATAEEARKFLVRLRALPVPGER